MTFHRKLANVTAMATALAVTPAGGVESIDASSHRRYANTPPEPFQPRVGRGKYRGPRNKPPSQKKRRLGDRRSGRFS